MVSGPDQVGVLLTVAGLFVLAWQGVLELAVEAGGVEPVAVLEHRELGLGAGAPGAGELDEFGLEQPDRCPRTTPVCMTADVAPRSSPHVAPNNTPPNPSPTFRDFSQ